LRGGEVTVCDLFAGIGGFSLGLERAGMTIKHQVEIDGFCNRVLEKHWPNVTRSTDIRQVKPEQIGPVDVICGGFPCQPASHAGKRRGTEDDRWLWPEAIKIVREVNPEWCIFENVPGLTTLERGVVFDDVLSDLERAGYAAWPLIIPACAVNAPHRRDRVWIVAYANSKWQLQPQGCEPEQRGWVGNGCGDASDADQPGPQERQRQAVERSIGNWNEPWLEAAIRLCSLDDGIPGRLVQPRGWRVNALKAAGNSVVPQIVEQIGRAIMESSKGIPSEGYEWRLR
jgi:DNA (cytosine-5)-methyltransferase 1